MIRPAPPVPPDTRPGAGKGAAKLPRPGPSAEGRQRLSELAKARHRAGGFVKSADGGARTPKRKPSKRRVATLVAEAAQQEKNAQAIIDVFKDAIQPTQPTTIRLKAAEAWLKVEGEDAKQMLREADIESQKRDRAELLDILSEKLTTGHAALLLRKQLEQQAGITDATVIEGHVIE